MKREYIYTALFFTLAVIIFYLAFLVFRPFLVAITWGIILAMIFFPVYKLMRQKIKNKVITSIILCVLIFIIIIAPFVYLGAILVDEAVNAYHNIETNIRSGEYQSLMSFTEHPYFISLRERIGQYVDISKLNVPSQILNVLNKIQSFILKQIGSTVRMFYQLILDFIFIFLTMYYMFKDGEKVINHFKGIIPLSEEQRNFIFHQLRDVSYATIYGGIIIALLQGFLGGLAFLILEIPSPVFWGAIMALLSFFPLIGAWLIYFPAVVVLIIQGSIIKAVILLIWGFGIISLADNFLRPFLVSGRTQIHPLILFFSIFGGLKVFGFLGIIVGPMLASIFIVFLNIMKKQIQEPIPQTTQPEN